MNIALTQEQLATLKKAKRVDYEGGYLQVENHKVIYYASSSSKPTIKYFQLALRQGTSVVTLTMDETLLAMKSNLEGKPFYIYRSNGETAKQNFTRMVKKLNGQDTNVEGKYGVVIPQDYRNFVHCGRKFEIWLTFDNGYEAYKDDLRKMHELGYVHLDEERTKEVPNHFKDKENLIDEAVVSRGEVSISLKVEDIDF